MESPRSNTFDVMLEIEERVKRKQPTSMVRLGDREGAMLAYPDICNRNAINRSIVDWFGHTNLTDKEVIKICDQMRDAVRNADIVGMPRVKQTNLHPHYQLVVDADSHYGLLAKNAIVTDAAIHRYLQFTLFFRRLLSGRDFVGLISPRDIEPQLKKYFSIENIVRYSVKGQAKYEGQDSTEHFPDGFNLINKTLEVPYQGALFLVGAGGLGKIYCHWIKERGGIALDIGAIFDAWAGVKSRLVHECHQLGQYDLVPKITFEGAANRFNELCEHFKMDTARVDITEYPDHLNETW